MLRVSYYKICVSENVATRQQLDNAPKQKVVEVFKSESFSFSFNEMLQKKKNK